MRKSRSQNRTKRNPRDPSPEREAQAKRDRATDTSDGVIDDELDELDTDRYEPPPPRE
jgi:hypothetical protein